LPRVTEEYKQVIDEKILDAARTLFSSKGYHETSMDDIVEESGLSKGAIYGHFESKEKLFLAVQQRKLDAKLKTMESLFSAEDSAKERLQKALDSQFDENCGATREGCMMHLEILFTAARNESLRTDVEKRATSAYRFWRDILEEGVKRKEFRQDLDIESIAPILDAAVDGLSLHWMIGHDFDWTRMKKAFLQLATSGMIPNGHK
jgi:AcrR family transcriptional regulator